MEMYAVKGPSWGNQKIAKITIPNGSNLIEVYPMSWPELMECTLMNGEICGPVNGYDEAFAPCDDNELLGWLVGE